MQVRLTVVVQCCLAVSGALTACAHECPMRHRSFSQTQVLPSEVISVVEKRSSIPALAELKVSIAGPPSSTEKTCAELFELHELVQFREDHLSEILCERHISCFRFDGIVIGDEENERQMPITLKLLSSALFLLKPVLYEAKLKFDRVRPSFADTSLTTAIAVPDHPSYPSGHAAQATLIAEIFSLLSPSRRQAFSTDAERIARNREIAGLHYRSDSVAGAELARVFLDKLRKEPWFRGMLARAKQEWHRQLDGAALPWSGQPATAQIHSKNAPSLHATIWF